MTVHDRLEDLIEGPVITDAETGEGKILVAGEFQSLFHSLQ